ncbi:hypothetical protein FS749_009349 [Ceratobasidium sp. UAMH 11750]|nr:hypothetical protein FS749_009349 [Ceratobasidium sp. UAMH 11750]
MIINTYASSATFGGAGIASTVPFDDSANDLDLNRSITKVEFDTGWVTHGMRVTYQTAKGVDRAIPHGTFSATNVGNSFFTVAAGEYISKVEGVHGHPNGSYDYGDCVQKIRFTIKNSTTNQERVTPYYGLAQNLPAGNAVPFTWEGRLYSFGGLTKDPDPTNVKLKALSFNKLSGQIVLAVSTPYAGTGRSAELLGQQYDDMASLGQKVDFNHPIKSLKVWSEQIVHGLEITYNLTDGTTKTVGHGAQAGTKSEVVLSANENIIEIKGLHGVSFPGDKDWADQVQLLQFTIHDTITDFLRTTPTFGTGQGIVQETRKDIYVRGRLVGVAGTANNSLQTAGLNTIMFYTLPPA